MAQILAFLFQADFLEIRECVQEKQLMQNLNAEVKFSTLICFHS